MSRHRVRFMKSRVPFSPLSFFFSSVHSVAQQCHARNKEGAAVCHGGSGRGPRGRQWKALKQICLGPSFCTGMLSKAQQSSARQTNCQPATHTDRLHNRQTAHRSGLFSRLPAVRPCHDTGTPAIERQGFSLAIHIFSVAAQTLDPPLPTPFGEPASLRPAVSTQGHARTSSTSNRSAT